MASAWLVVAWGLLRFVFPHTHAGISPPSPNGEIDMSSVACLLPRLHSNGLGLCFHVQCCAVQLCFPSPKLPRDYPSPWRVLLILPSQPYESKCPVEGRLLVVHARSRRKLIRGLVVAPFAFPPHISLLLKSSTSCLTHKTLPSIFTTTVFQSQSYRDQHY